LYVTITESKKVFEDGKEFYQKHKIFLYKEDFQKFIEGFEETISKLEEIKLENGAKSESNSEFESLTFESL
jgi:hypothetical protein